MSSLQDAVARAIKKKVNPQVDIAVGKMLLEIKRDTAQYVPRKTGELENSVVIGTNSISYEAEYADRVYTMKNAKFSTSINPLARAYWLKDSIAINKPRWVKNFKKNL